MIWKWKKKDCRRIEGLFLPSQVFEPSELEKGMLTNKDNEIRTADVPERFQVRCEKLYMYHLLQTWFIFLIHVSSQ